MDLISEAHFNVIDGLESVDRSTINSRLPTDLEKNRFRTNSTVKMRKC